MSSQLGSNYVAGPDRLADATTWLCSSRRTHLELALRIESLQVLFINAMNYSGGCD
jgi:hypothetical protein